MARSDLPSYASLVFEALKAAEHPLTFREIIEAVEQRRPITTRDPKSTVRAAIRQGHQIVSLDDGRYWYLPHCVRGSLVRTVFTEKKPARQPIVITFEVLEALWPSFFGMQSRRSNRPVHVRLPTGEEAALTLSHHGFGWAIPVDEPLQGYLVDQRAGAGDSLLIRVLDAEAGQAEAWFESRTRRPREAIAVRNQAIADAVYAFVRERRRDRVPIWDIATALLARGIYRADTAPDPLGTVLRADQRFDTGLSGPLARLVSETASVFVALRELPDPASLTMPPNAIYQLKVTLQGSNPPIWRRLLVPAGTRLSTLHHLLQIAMGWADDHLHMFRVGRRSIGDPSFGEWTEVEDENKVRLSDTVARVKSRLTYEYDFGDGWLHDILVEKILPPDPEVTSASCIEGSRACPPEDVGGIWGYADFLEALADPSYPSHEDRLEWIGDDFDAEIFDLEAVNARLSRIRVP